MSSRSNSNEIPKGRLLVTMATLGAGGAERVLSVLSKAFADSFEDVYYVLWEGGKVFYQLDSRIRIVSLPELSGRSGRIHQMMTFRKYVNTTKPDIILSFLTPYNMLVLLSTIGLKQSIVVAERTDPRRLLSGGRIMLRIRDVLYRRAKGILTQTEYAKSCYKGSLRLKTSVIYNPIIMEKSYVGRGLRTGKKQLFIAAGRLESVKDHSMMIRAFYQFQSNHPDYKLYIYGEGPLKERLQQEVEKLNLQNNVILAGNSRHVWDEMISAECFLLSSKYEGMSNAMIEAMCLGLPVISTKVAGATDLIENGMNGFLVEVGDSKGMCDKMNQLVSNKELTKKMGQAAVDIYEYLQEDKISDQWINYLKKIMES